LVNDSKGAGGYGHFKNMVDVDPSQVNHQSHEVSVKGQVAKWLTTQREQGGHGHFKDIVDPNQGNHRSHKVSGQIFNDSGVASCWGAF
jgi:hypothetical protein